MTKNIFDTHAHYDSDAFDTDREALLANLPEKGVCGVINCGVNLARSKDCLALSRAHPFCFAAVGVHPEDIGGEAEGWPERLEAMLSAPKVVAVGEIGLDYHWAENAPRETQQAAFATQLALAAAHSLPVIIHDRDAHADTFALLRAHKPRGVLHCFSGSVELAREALSLGLYIGLGGAATFKNARVPLQVAAMLPADRLLLETDCPYMTPEPFRGKRNDSSLIIHVAQRIAEIRGVPADELLLQTRRNAEELFGV